jgi:hypothetical protein
MQKISSIATISVALVMSLATLGFAFARPFETEGCRRDPNSWTEMRSNIKYTCFKQVCCLDSSCLGPRPLVRPTIETRCFPSLPNGNLKLTPTGFGHGHGLPTGGGTVPGTCTGSTAC